MPKSGMLEVGGVWIILLRLARRSTLTRRLRHGDECRCECECESAEEDSVDVDDDCVEEDVEDCDDVDEFDDERRQRDEFDGVDISPCASSLELPESELESDVQPLEPFSCFVSSNGIDSVAPP